MKQTVIHKALAIILALTGPVSATATKVIATAANKVVKLNFDESMFKIDETDGFVNSIQYVKSNSSMPGDTSAPALPLVYFRVSAPGGVDCTFSPRILSQKLLMNNVDISVTPEIIPTNQIGKISAEPKSKRYTGQMYPAEICTKTGKSQWSDATVFHFACSPFVYDGKRRNLYLIQEMEVNVNFTDLPAEKLNYVRTQMTRMPEFLKPPLDSTLYGIVDTATQIVGPAIPEDRIYTVDYLIITSDYYKSCFDPLINWKKTKGLTAEVVTIEDIQNKMTGKDYQAKIKNYIKKSVSEDRTKFVLLGGDECVLPPRYCKGDDSDTQNKKIPSDLYFACLNDPYDWDENGNGVYGEPEDHISTEPCVAVTRLPLNSKKDFETYIKRLMEYETNPAWGNSMLLTGAKLDETTPALSDCQSIYKLLSRNNWGGTCVELFDEYNSIGIPKGEDAYTSQNLDTQIANGHSFIHISSHGEQYGYRMQNYSELYNVANARNQVFPCHSIITTNACFTNAFDNDGPFYSNATCLSEGFLMNKQNAVTKTGVVAYYGASRYGYSFPPEIVKTLGYGPSTLFNFKFYEQLYDDYEGPVNKNFGSIVASSKDAAVYPEVKTFDWVKLSTNPMGDPEMPIFTREPMVFSNVTASCADNIIEISTGEPDCRICVKGLGDGSSFSKIFNNKETVEVKNLPDQFTVCINKQNFKPWLYSYNKKPDGSYQISEVTTEQFFLDNLGLHPIKGQILKVENSTVGASISSYEIYTLVSDTASEAYLTVTSINSNMIESCNRYNVEPGECKTTIISSGTLTRLKMKVVDLIVDGEIQESIKLF